MTTAEALSVLLDAAGAQMDDLPADDRGLLAAALDHVTEFRDHVAEVNPERGGGQGTYASVQDVRSLSEAVMGTTVLDGKELGALIITSLDRARAANEVVYLGDLGDLVRVIGGTPYVFLEGLDRMEHPKATELRTVLEQRLTELRANGVRVD